MIRKRYANYLLSTIKAKSTVFANQTGEQVDTWVKEDGSGWTMGSGEVYYAARNPYHQPAIHMIGLPNERTVLCDPNNPAYCEHTRQTRIRVHYA